MTRDQEGETLGSAHYPDPMNIGDYSVMDAVSRNDFSTVYRCAHSPAHGVKREGFFAVKLLAPKWTDHAFKHVFQKNIERLVGRGLPHCVPILEAGMLRNRPFAVMPFLNGHSLADIARRAPLRPSLALRCVGEAARGLQTMAFDAGLLHGDIQPRNLLFCAGEVTVIGFGQSPPYQVSPQKSALSDPHYIAPETITSGHQDIRSDIYALGCTLFHLLTRDPPYGSGSSHAQLACHLHEPFPLVKDKSPSVPDAVDDFLQKMCAKDPEKRLQSYDDVITATAGLAPSLASISADVPMVLIEVGREAGKSIPLADGETILGREADTGILVDDGRVSRRHAVLQLRGSSLEVRDLGSRNGIKVNGQSRKRCALLNDDRITLGDTVLRIIGVQRSRDETETKDMAAPLPVSPVRGAFGAAEVARAPSVQAGPEGLTKPVANPALEKIRIELLGALSIELATAGDAILHPKLIVIAQKSFAADAGIFLAVQNNAPVFSASTAEDAALLSSSLPAVERAIAGRLSLCTSVQVGRDQTHSVLLCPFVVKQGLRGYFILSKKSGRFDAGLLPLLEGASHLFARREEGA
ncbi:MAG: FHA domain-containing protein [Deltaproteobacteria bacterium]|nr:FHA domain-containing protein [Deltaproteobacteria bacterium]